MTLNWELVAKYMRPHEQLRNKLQQKIHKLEAHLEHFPEDAVHLQVHLLRNPKKPLFTASLTLGLPSNILHAEKTAEDPLPAFDLAVKALLREVSFLKASLRREDQWKPSERGELVPPRSQPARVVQLPVSAVP